LSSPPNPPPPLPTLHLSHPSRRHQKTRRDGGAAAHGWPDEGYVARLRSEAAAIGLETATEGSSLSETAGEGGAAAEEVTVEGGVAAEGGE
jgi:hypothetical protein